MTIQWPLQDPKTGKPQTTPTNQSIWKAAIEPARKEYPEAVAEWCDQLANCRNWRSDYINLIHDFVDIQSQCTPETIHAMCQAGLDMAQKVFQMAGNEDEAPAAASESVAQAFQNALAQTNSSLNDIPTSTHTGGSSKSSNDPSEPYLFPLASPHGTDTNPLWVTGDQAVAQCRAWETYGCMEPSATTDAQTIFEASNAADFVDDKVFCLLGVTSEMGPTKHLLKIPGAHVLGIARAGHKTRDLLAWFAEEGHPTATLTLMEHGADMLKDGPTIAQWLIQQLTQQARKHVVLMPLAYMDGEANVRVTVVMDAIVTHVLQAVESQDMIGHLAYLTSPTTCYTIPPEAAQNAQYRYEHERGLLPDIIHFLSLGNILAPSNEWDQLAGSDNAATTSVLHNGLVPLQGPNYALAKTMQQWRCMLYHSQGKGRVSAPMAPGSRTQSVVHSPEASAALEGVQYLPPMISFDSVPCSSLMTAIVLAQLSTDKDKSTSPFQLFWKGAVHGGGWRCPYNLQTCYAMAYILGRTIAKQGWCPEGALAKLEQA